MTEIPTPETDAETILKSEFAGRNVPLPPSNYVPAAVARFLERRLAVATEALEAIAEYWNGAANETAIHDAVQHNCATAAEALRRIAELRESK